MNLGFTNTVKNRIMVAHGSKFNVDKSSGGSRVVSGRNGSLLLFPAEVTIAGCHMCNMMRVVFCRPFDKRIR